MTNSPDTHGDSAWLRRDQLSYAESLEAVKCVSVTVDVTQQFVGDVPGGYRIDLYYSGENKPVKVPIGSPLESLRPYLAKAFISSGNDWVTVSSEAVIDFDGRITLSLVADQGSNAELRCPIAGRLRGRASFRDTLRSGGSPLFDATTSASQVIAQWKAGFPEQSYLPLVLAVSFDIPTRGFNEEQTKVYDKARPLAASLFVAGGTAEFRTAPYGAVKTIELALFKTQAHSLSASSLTGSEDEEPADVPA